MISVGLNLILGLLLFCALVLGVRLERRLRGLRQGHADFAKAVNELDQAAVRTESSLQALRAGTESAKNELASRIDQARIACQRLEKLSADAERIASRPLPLSQPVMSQPMALSQPVALAPAGRAPPPPLTQAHVGDSALARPDAEALRPAAPVQTRPAPAPEPSRSRAKLVDDDLFATGAPPPPRRPQPVVDEPAALEGEPLALRADNDPLIGAPPPARPANDRSANDRSANDRAAREAFYREVLDRESFTPDPFESGRFARERRVMLAAVMGGRR